MQLNGTAFRTGQTVRFTATLTPGSTPALVDAYVMVRLPNGGVLSLVAIGRTAPGTAPIGANFQAFSFNGEVLSYTFGGTEPPGTYMVMTMLTTPGTLNPVGTLDMDTFTFTP